MMLFTPVVRIPKPTWRRIAMLVNEISFMQNGEELEGLDLESTTEAFIQRIVDEYVHQYFEESTRTAAELVVRRQQQRQRRLLDF